MTQPNFYQMSRTELRAYILKHKDDKRAFHAYMDKLANEPVLASGTLEDLEDPHRFAELLETIQRAKKQNNQ
ncbi:MAG: hypothetical protein IGR93_02490 [Hydrococcus sp. C42_A2020_068]|uniref:DUF6887 family protein n=1 Tax=Pleurocapsa sp. PCC 7327 TaxID=118163 RepID=UPI00029FAFF4|nr:hypothetical protein [Pleurocapsa sp. PCC 7327]AFY76193.1 hypothetical protein Ple7327_0763 [Pleurocapsa sp. PCC 7327]MBF2018995.1 hypothetical protein [Hydrococcus sp. C42_A2020_068]